MYILYDNRALSPFDSRRKSLYTEKSFQIMHPTKHENLPSKYPLPPKKKRKTAAKDTLKPEMQRELTHHLYNYKVKNTFCGKAAVMPVSTTFCFVSATLGFVSSIK